MSDSEEVTRDRSIETAPGGLERSPSPSSCCSAPASESHSVPVSSVGLIGGSPLFVLDERPIAWLENWIRARTRRGRMR